MSTAAMTALAMAAAEAWGGCLGTPRLVAQRENTVFDLRLADGARVALRLHRRGNVDPVAVGAELAWTEALAEAGVACPAPRRTRTGELAIDCDAQLVSAVAWIDAPPLAEAPGDPVQQHHRLGATLADLHSAADRLRLCPVPRRTWKRDDLIGEVPRWGGHWLNPALDDAERTLLAEARDAARRQLAAVSHPDVGLIHADTLRENVLDDGARLWLIDFDDSGFGYRGYDLATALIQQIDLPGWELRAEALLEGYLSRRPDAARLRDDLAMFVLIRGLATAGWIVNRAPHDDPRQRLYAERALAAARLYLGG
ncbi:phosphotransferase enzyme family protein [Tropicimonas aquimaris]|uniref:Phosphotransferase enzyme family protein n=1 Tax=Tropicimonas aquimaris TaxID=914152 RepID=A0ABW3IWV3_9RHOB